MLITEITFVVVVVVVAALYTDLACYLLRYRIRNIETKTPPSHRENAMLNSDCRQCSVPCAGVCLHSNRIFVYSSGVSLKASVLFFFFLSSFHTENCHLNTLMQWLLSHATNQPTYLWKSFAPLILTHTHLNTNIQTYVRNAYMHLWKPHIVQNTPKLFRIIISHKLHVIRNVSPFVIWICNGKKRVRDWMYFVSVCVCIGHSHGKSHL